ncbi:TPA: hypothetical protein ACJFVL_004943, partial [Escherichia coli]
RKKEFILLSSHKHRISCFPDADASFIFQQNILLLQAISSAYNAGHRRQFCRPEKLYRKAGAPYPG